MVAMHPEDRFMLSRGDLEALEGATMLSWSFRICCRESLYSAVTCALIKESYGEFGFAL